MNTQYIPNIMGAVLERLTQQSKTSELKTMCLQVVSTLDAGLLGKSCWYVTHQLSKLTGSAPALRVANVWREMYTCTCVILPSLRRRARFELSWHFPAPALRVVMWSKTPAYMYM